VLQPVVHQQVGIYPRDILWLPILLGIVILTADAVGKIILQSMVFKYFPTALSAGRCPERHGDAIGFQGIQQLAHAGAEMASGIVHQSVVQIKTDVADDGFHGGGNYLSLVTSAASAATAAVQGAKQLHPPAVDNALLNCPACACATAMSRKAQARSLGHRKFRAGDEGFELAEEGRVRLRFEPGYEVAEEGDARRGVGMGGAFSRQFAVRIWRASSSLASSRATSNSICTQLLKGEFPEKGGAESKHAPTMRIAASEAAMPFRTRSAMGNCATSNNSAAIGATPIESNASATILGDERKSLLVALMKT